MVRKMGSMLHGLATDKRKLLVSVVLIFALAAFLRLYHIGWSFSDNGIDEGIMLERSFMVGQGYSLYSELPCDQAPLAFLIGGLLGGDLLSLRVMVALLSIAAIGACMLAAKRTKGNVAMLVAGLLITVDFAFLRESRLFSLDLLAGAFVAFSIPPFLGYLRNGNRYWLAMSGLLLGLSAASKLLGVLPLLGLIIFMVLERKSEPMRRRWLPDSILLLAFSAIPLAVFLAWLGPEPMIRGMLLDQGHRGADLALKLSIVAYFGLNLAYLLPFLRLGVMWRSGPAQRALFCMTGATLAFMVLQPLTFFHHLVLMSPPLAILAGVAVEDLINAKEGVNEHSIVAKCSKKLSRKSVPFVAIALVGILVSGGLAGYGLAAQGRNAQYDYANLIRHYAGPGDFVIAGDPTMAAIAERMVPPTAINVAYRVFPEVTLDSLKAAIDGNVTVVVLCYRLNKIPGLTDYLESQGFDAVDTRLALSDRPVLSLFEEGLGTVTFYVRQA